MYNRKMFITEYTKNPIINFFAIPFSILIILLIFSCNIQKPEKEATKTAQQYFELVKSGKLENAYKLYSDFMFLKTPKDAWLKTLENTRKDLGELKSYNLETSKIIEIKNNQHSGTYVYLVYRVEYANKEAKELITVGNSNIVGHYINLENTDAAKFLEHVLDRQTISSR